MGLKVDKNKLVYNPKKEHTLTVDKSNLVYDSEKAVKAKKEKNNEEANNSASVTWQGFTPSGNKGLGATNVSTASTTTLAKSNSDLALDRMIANAKEQSGGQAWDEETLRLNKLKNDREKLLSYMTPTQKAEYNNTEQNARDSYIKAIRDELNQKLGLDYAEEILNEKDKGNQFAKTTALGVASGLDMFKSGMRGVGNAVADKVKGNEKATQTTRGANEYAFGAVRPNVGTGTGIVMDSMQSIGNMLPSMAIGAATGGLGLPFSSVVGSLSMGLASGGNSYDEAAKEGTSVNRALVYGAANGVKEVLLQQIVGALPGINKADSFARKLIGNMGDSVATKILGNRPIKDAIVGIMANALSEGTEEAAQEAIETLLGNVILGKDDKLSVKDMAYSGLLGGITGGAFPAIGEVTKGVSRDRGGVNSNVNAVNVNRSVENVNNNVENVNNNVENVNGNVNTEQSTFQKGIEKFKSGDYTSADDIVVLEEAPLWLYNKGIDWDTPVTINMNKLKDVMKEPKGRNNGTNQHGITMDIVEKLPEAIKNPLNVIKPNGFNDRYVVITDLIDQYGDPIIVPIQVNSTGKKDGVVIDVSKINSIYGKEDYDVSSKGKPKGYMAYNKDNIVYDIDKNGVSNGISSYRFHPNETPFSNSNNIISDNSENINNINDITEENTENIIEEEGTPITDSLKMTLRAVNPNATNSQQIYRQIMTNNGYGEMIKRMDGIANRLGGEVIFYADNSNSEGYNIDGRIYLNVNKLRSTAEAEWKVFKHELTHSLEGTKAYGELMQSRAGEELYLEFLKNKGYTETDETGRTLIMPQNLENEIRERYARNGINLSEEEVLNECIAKFIEESDILENEQTIEALAKGSPNFAQRVLNWIKDTLSKLGSDYETNRLRKAERLYEKALRQAEKGQFEYERNGVRQESINPDFVNEYDKWDGVNGRIHFNVGTTSEALQSIGVDPKEIYWDSSKIIKTKKDHPNITDDVIKQVPEILENPVLIMQSKKRDSRLTLYGEVYDIYNRPVLAVLELEPTEKNRYSLDYMKIASTYSKTGTESRTARENTQQLVNDSKILYVDSNKERTENWFSQNRLSLPLAITNFGSNETISQNMSDVNTEIGTNLGELLQEAQEKAKFSVAEDGETKLTAEERKIYREYEKEVKAEERAERTKMRELEKEAEAKEQERRRAYRKEVTELFREDAKSKRESEKAEKAAKREEKARTKLGEKIGEKREELAEKRRIREEEEARINEKVLRLETDRKYQKEFYKGYGKTRTVYDRLVSKEGLTADDIGAMRMLRDGRYTMAEIEARNDKLNVEGIKKVYEVYKGITEYDKVQEQYRKNAREGYRKLAKEMTETSDGWKDKGIGLAYSRETQERNIEDITKGMYKGDKKWDKGERDNPEAKRIIRTYFEPVHKNEAKSTRFKNDYVKRVKELKLGTNPQYTVTVKNETTGLPMQKKVSESGLVQLYGEKIIDDTTLNGLKADKEKIHKAVDEFRTMYDEMLEKTNEVLIRNGYEPVQHRNDYFPHFTDYKADTKLGKIGSYFGFENAGSELPTDIAGITDTFRPGKKWVSNFLERKGSTTDYDAVKGFDNYINGVADVIFHTDDIQRLRALETEIRYRNSDKATQDKLNEIINDDTLTTEDRNNRISEIFEDRKIGHLANYVQNLKSYTDNLAGKKSEWDRGFERAFGRKIYKGFKGLENRVSANMVAINPASWLTNFIPITQVYGLVDSKTLAKAIVDTGRSAVNNDGFVYKSDFLTNRRGTDEAWQRGGKLGKVKKVSDAFTLPFEWIDNASSEVVTRALYYSGKKQGMTESEALSYANDKAARLMADRSKGANPTVFNATNPVFKAGTMFQTEVNNQFSFLFKDVPSETLRKKGLEALGAALFKIFFTGWLYNEVYEYFIGRRPAFDPIDIIGSTIGDIADEKTSTADMIGNFTSNVVEELPFVSNLAGGGRIPVTSAIPDVSEVKDALFDKDTAPEKRRQTLMKEAAKPLFYVATPIGGGQIKKSLEGFSTIKKGGEYTYDKDGNKRLKYAVENPTAETYARGILFGKSALSEAQEYYNSGSTILSAKQTQNYHKAVEAGINFKQYKEALNSVKGIESDKDKDGKTIALSKAKKQKAAVDKAMKKYNLTKKQMELLYDACGITDSVW